MPRCPVVLDMPYRRRQSTFDDILDELFALLRCTPVWVGPVLAVVVFILLRFVLPALMPVKQAGLDAGNFFRPLLMTVSWFLAGAVLVVWALAEIWKRTNRRLLDSQTDLSSIKDISWRDFERLVCEAYRRQGYLAEVVGSDSGDGGVDVLLHGRGQKALVQCKQWQSSCCNPSWMRTTAR